MALAITLSRSKLQVTYPYKKDEGENEVASIEEMDSFNELDELRALEPKEAMELPNPVTIKEVVYAQAGDDVFRATWVGKPGSGIQFTETEDGVLRRLADDFHRKIVLPDSLRERVLNLAHFSRLTGHPDQTQMFDKLRRKWYRPQMSADVATKVRNCGECAKNRLRLRKCTNPLQLFTESSPLE